MITIRTDNTRRDILAFKLYLKMADAEIGTISYQEQHRDYRHAYFNVFADDEDKLEEHLSRVTDAYTRY